MAKGSALNLTEGSIKKLIIDFSWPVFIAWIFTELYNVTNAMLVGNFVSLEALSAVSASTWICNIFNYTFAGLGMGAGILIAKYYGAKDEKNLKKALDTAVVFALVGGLSLTIIAETLLPVMMKICNIKADIYSLSESYLRVYLLGNTAVLTSQMCFNILRSFGDTKHQLYYSVASSIINVILGMTFVRVFHLSVIGTALATIISQYVTDVLALKLLLNYDDINFSFKNLDVNFRIVLEICSLGIPAGIQNLLIAFSSMLVQSYVNLFPNEIIAAIGVAEKIINWAQMFCLAISSATMALVAQNLGAKKYERAKEAVKECVKLSTICTLFAIIVLFAIAPIMVTRFNKDPQVLKYGTEMIRYAIFGILFLNFSHIYNAACRGAGNVKLPMLIAVLSQVVFKYLFVYVGLKISFDVHVLYFGTAAGYTMAGILATLYFNFSKWTKDNKLR